LYILHRFVLSSDYGYAIVVGKDDLPHILPLLTMTGISYLKPKK